VRKAQKKVEGREMARRLGFLTLWGEVRTVGAGQSMLGPGAQFENE
jgi:hypothetical protein